MDTPETAGKHFTFRTRRLRFLECIPESIQSISFSEDGSHLALSRSDGNLELWVNSGGILQKKLRIPGKSNCSIETMAWCGNRLFTGSLSGNVEEWDFVQLQPCHSDNLNGGPIWCLKLDSSGRIMAAGCENGKVYLIQVSRQDSGGIQLLTSYGQEKSRILCSAWSPNSQHIAIGTSNGLIKKIDVSNGCCELGIACEKKAVCIIWDIAYINSSIISADSLGRVQFWSDEHGTLLQSFKEHNLDVLSISATLQGNTVFSSGVDQKIVCYKRVNETKEWIKSNQLKIHTHDVRAMDLSNSGLLATGGIDTNLCIVPIENFDLSHAQKYSAFEDSAEYISMDSQARFVVQQNNTAVKVWSISQGVHFLPVNILDIKSNCAYYILSAAIAPNGSAIAVSTVNNCFLYDITCGIFKCFLKLDIPSYKLSFSNDGFSLLLATITKGICLLDTQSTRYREVVSFQEIHSSLPITTLSVNSKFSHFVLTGYNNETFLYSIVSGTALCKLPSMCSHTPIYSFTHSGNTLLVFTSGKLMKYDIPNDKIVELGTVKNCRAIPRGLYVMSESIAVLQYLEGLSLFQFEEFQEIHSQNISSNYFKISGILLSMSVCDDNTIIMVEQPSNKLIKSLPPVLHRENYGT